jgi:hypothetical protein
MRTDHGFAILRVEPVTSVSGLSTPPSAKLDTTKRWPSGETSKLAAGKRRGGFYGRTPPNDESRRGRGARIGA